MTRGALARKRLDRVGHDQLALADDRDAVGDPLHLVERVGRQQHGAPLVDRLAQQLLELGLHQRVETGGRLVEDEQLRVGA